MILTYCRCAKHSLTPVLYDFQTDSSKPSGSASHAMAMPAVAEEITEAVDIPTKIVATKVNLNLRAQIQYLDFEG